MTHAAFTFDASGIGLYRTGDLGYRLADGCLVCAGRKDFQVKVRGYRIETAEIESALMQHAEVKEAAVVAYDDECGDKRLIAYVVGAGVQIDKLRAHLKAKLPDYMLPSSFVALDQMPLTPSGKLDRKALPRSDSARSDAVAYAAPRTPTEQTLAVIWAEVLKLDQVGIHDNFFELGGHSLLATQIVLRIHQSFGIELPSQALFESQTVAALARRIDALPGADGSRQAPPVVPVSRDGILPLSFSQSRLWFFDQLQPCSAVYNIPRAVRMTGRLDVESLRKALNSVVDRHESLHTCFSISADCEPQQLIAARLELALPVIDLRGLPHAQREAEAQRLIIEDGRRPFDLAHGPLLRVSLLRLGDEDHVCLLTYHHICGDNWSAGILFAELAAFYRAHREDTPASLPVLSIQYADFAYWQRRWLQGDALEQQLAYWKGQLSGAPEVLELPIDRPRPAVYSHAGNWQALSAPSDMMRALMALSRSESASLFMTLLAAYQILLWQFAAQNDVLVGAPIAGRNRAETEGLIGVFINTLVLRADCSPGRSIRELLREVRETTLAAYAHQDLPFDLLVSELRPKRRPDQTVLVQASFNWQNIRMPMPKLPGLTLRPVDEKASDRPGSGDSFEAQDLRAFLSNNQTVRFDLVLSMWMQGEELRGRLEYNSDIFEPRTMEELIAHYKILLEAIATDPDRRLADLPLLNRGHRQRSKSESISDSLERKARTMTQDQGSRRNKFMAIKPKAVSTARLVKTAYLQPDAALPLIIEPEFDHVDLIEWAKTNQQMLNAELLKYGALLFRGFRLQSALEFERFIRAISNDLIEYSYRSTPRTRVEGKIYTSTEYPAEQSIPLHNEMSYSRNWPMKIWFFSVQQATQGGETPIADSRNVFSCIDPKIRQRFSERKVMYVRNYGSGLDLSWQDVFQTTDKVELEAFCARAGMTLEWMDSDRLCTRQVCQAVAEHPRTKEWVWFNQAHLFHISSLHSEARECLLAQFGETNLPRNAYYGDGSPIEDSILDEIRGVYAEVETAFPWRESDILMLDNMLVAHGRRPFSGPRKVLVGMAEPFGMGERAIR
ncbi:MAG: condensation domain-containing protein [Burkholderiales bacterium]